MAPLVSVIVPVYNVSPYLRQCMDSIVNQTLKDIEIICVDDGSTDDSLTILQEYADNYNNIWIYTQDNKGSGPARNNGISYSTGKYIAFMDADDWYPSKDVLETLYIATEKYNVKIAGGTMMEYNNGQTSVAKGRLTFTDSGILKYSDYQCPYGYYRFIFEKKLLIENNITFPPYLRGQDPPFFVRAMIAAKKFYATSKITYCYRRGHTNINWNQRKLNDFLKNIIDLLIIANEYNYQYLYTFTIKIYLEHYVLAISNRLDCNNLNFVEIITKINALINDKLYELENKNWIDKHILPLFIHKLTTNSSKNHGSCIYSAIKSILFLAYLQIHNRL